MTDAITLAFATDGGSMAKRIMGGAVVNPPFRKVYRFEEVAVTSKTLLGALEDAAARGACVMRGRPKAPTGRNALHDHPVKGPAGLETAARWWVAVDADSVPLPPWIDPLDGEDCALEIAAMLPREFRGRAFVWQLTASAGVKPGARVRLWYWLSEPLGTAALKRWFDKTEVDDSVFEPHQPIFVGVAGSGAPQVQRFGYFRGNLAGTSVIVPPHVHTVDPPRPKPTISRPAHKGTMSKAFAMGRIAKALKAIRDARGKEGARTPTFKHHAASALWYARAGGVSQEMVADALHAAGRFMFEDDGHRVGRNIEGLLEWLGEHND